ncbi:MAG TPA: hypothetical protein G4N97_09855 [Thermoflexia bacterium]|nr:MAG: hypothetical protein DRI80_01765 [Chloroflexota bacterium]HEY68559.1 hypothetical protein [Thermoflexia bacterium]
MANNGKRRQEERLAEQLDRLTAATTALVREVEQLQKWHPLAGSLRNLLWRSFLQGVASGLGRAVGATVILALLVWLLGRLQVVPVLGAWIARLLEAIQVAQQGF